MKYRILEIDVQDHAGIPDDVSKHIAPLLETARTAYPGLQIKAGELSDADFPTNHSSYFVGIASVDDPDGQAAAEKLADEITRYCWNNRLPIMEVWNERPEYQRILGEFALGMAVD